MRRRLSRGFNLVEILITLTLIALLTTTLINFVNDFDDKTKVAKARNDLMRMAEQAVIAESKVGQQVSTASAGGSSIMTLLLDYLVELPDYDPWGNRYVVSAAGTVTRSDTQGVAYIVDPSFGRMICAGPDGVVNTRLGEGNADTDNDIVVEFRQQPWVAYSYTPNGGALGEIWVARLDGTGQAKVLPHNSFEAGASGAVNVTFSPDGDRWAGVKWPTGSNQMIYGNTSPVNPYVKVMPVPGAEPGVIIGSAAIDAKTYPMFLPDGNQVLWITNSGALWVSNLVTERTVQLMPDGSMKVDVAPNPADQEGRIVHTSRERSYYWKTFSTSEGGKGSIGIAASSDGKIAIGFYPATGKSGVYLLLPGSRARRLLKETRDPSTSTDNWMPMFWVDTGNLLYWGKGDNNRNTVRRIAQDGRFDIPLYGGADLLNPRNPVMPSISPDGSLMYFIHDGSNSGKIIRTDGGGFLKGSASLSNFPLSNTPTAHQAALWAQDLGSMFIVAAHAGNSGIRQVDFRLDTPGLAPEASSPTLNTVFPVTPIRAALSPNGLMVATVSSVADASQPEPGVHIFPLLGPESARVSISTTVPAGANENMPNVVWILN